MLPSNRPLLMGITGNMGSGKSSFCNMLETNGLRVIYADTIAQQRLEDKAVIDTLVLKYSESILKNTGLKKTHVIDRKHLADIVFNCPEETKYLNTLIHPLVLNDFAELVANAEEPYLGFEVPLLFEAGLKECFDYLVLVYVPLELRLQRLLDKGDNRENALKRMQHQIPDEDKLFQVDLAIDNSSGISQLENSAKALIAKLPQLKQKHIRPFSNCC